MEHKFVVNIGRQLGSGGLAIGKIVADHFGIEIYDKRLIRLSAEQSGMQDRVFEVADESKRHTRMSTLMSYLRNPFVGSEVISGGVLSSESLFKIQSDVIRDVAQRGSAIFVGRCADYILRDHPLAINIFISANIEDRVSMVSANYEVGSEQARSIIKAADTSRASYYNYFSTGEWGAAKNYDLCVNSSLLGQRQSAEYIIKFIEARLSR